MHIVNHTCLGNYFASLKFFMSYISNCSGSKFNYIYRRREITLASIIILSPKCARLQFNCIETWKQWLIKYLLNVRLSQLHILTDNKSEITRVLQCGHVLFCRFHSIIQLLQNLWPHGIQTVSSVITSWHITQISINGFWWSLKEIYSYNVEL